MIWIGIGLALLVALVALAVFLHRGDAKLDRERRDS